MQGIRTIVSSSSKDDVREKVFELLDKYYEMSKSVDGAKDIIAAIAAAGAVTPLVLGEPEPDSTADDGTIKTIVEAVTAWSESKDDDRRSPPSESAAASDGRRRRGGGGGTEER